MSAAADPSASSPRAARLRALENRRAACLTVLAGGLVTVELAAVLSADHVGSLFGMRSSSMLLTPVVVGTGAVVAYSSLRTSMPERLDDGRSVVRAVAVFVGGFVVAVLAMLAAVVASRVSCGEYTDPTDILTKSFFVGASCVAAGWLGARAHGRALRAFVDVASLDALSSAGGSLALEPAPEGAGELEWAARYEPVARGPALPEGAFEGAGHVTEVAVTWGDELLSVTHARRGARVVELPGAASLELGPMRDGARAVKVPSAWSGVVTRGGVARSWRRDEPVLAPGETLELRAEAAAGGYRVASSELDEQAAPFGLRVRTVSAAARTPRRLFVDARASVIGAAAIAGTAAWAAYGLTRPAPEPRDDAALPREKALYVGASLARQEARELADGAPEETQVVYLDSSDMPEDVRPIRDPLDPRWSGPLTVREWRAANHARAPLSDDDHVELLASFLTVRLYAQPCWPGEESESCGLGPPPIYCGSDDRRVGTRGLVGIGDPSAPQLGGFVDAPAWRDPLAAVRGPLREPWAASLFFGERATPAERAFALATEPRDVELHACFHGVGAFRAARSPCARVTVGVDLSDRAHVLRRSDAAPDEPCSTAAPDEPTRRWVHQLETCVALALEDVVMPAELAGRFVTLRVRATDARPR